MNADQIRAIFREELQAALAAFSVAPVAPHNPQLLSVGQQALLMAKQGRVEESKALLKAHSKMRAA